ncbi:MAG: putative ABC exporter domain-containing protein [Armatimonadota bacterium]
MRTLLYLDIRQLINLIMVTKRTPKRLIPIIGICVWLAIVIIPQRLTGNQQPNIGIVNIIMPESLWAFIFLVLSMISLQMIHKSFSESVLVFTMSEVDMIFPTPLGQKQVIALKLLKLYAKSAFFLLFFMIFLYPSFRIFGFASMGVSLLSVWISAFMFSVLLTNICIVINLISSNQKSMNSLPAKFVKTAAYAFFLLIAVGVFMRYMRTGDIIQSLTSTLTHPVFTSVLVPVKWTADLLTSPVRLWLTDNLSEFVLMVSMVAVSIFMVLSRDENPYEPSLAVSAKYAAVRSAWRSGNWMQARSEMMKSGITRVNTKYGIKPFGKGAIALIWKNLNVTARTSARGWGILAGLIMIGLLIARNSGMVNAAQINSITPFAIIYLLIFGSGIMSHSLRSDMKQSNMLRPIPIPAWHVVAAESVHGAVIISVMYWAMMGMIAAIFGLPAGSPLILTALCMPAISYLCFSAEVAAIVIYPNWDDITQRYLSQMACTFASIFGTLLPMGVGIALWYLKVPVMIIALIITVLCAVLSAAGIALGTAAYRRHDPSDE